MSDSEPISVIPILSYANPQGGQPAYGRLRTEYQSNAFILTDPQSAATRPMVIRVIGSALVFLGLIFAVFNFIPEQFNGGGDPRRALLSLFAFICGAYCFRHASKMKQPPRVLRVSDGRLYTTGCPGHDRLSGRFRVRKFILLRGSIDMKTSQSVHSLRVRYGWGLTMTLIPMLSHDEGLWAIGLLENALNQID